MEHKLINTGSYLLVLSDEEIKESDYGYYMAGKSIQKVKIGENYSNPKAHKKIICHLPINNSPIISDLDLLPPLEQEDDVEKLAEQWFDNANTERWGGETKGFIEGYNKAKEKYDELLKWIDTEILLNPHYKDSPRLREGASMVKVKLQSLSQPKLPVTFKCATIDEAVRNEGEDINGKNAFRYEPQLKTTTNSQGQTVWVGEYIY